MLLPQITKTATTAKKYGECHVDGRDMQGQEARLSAKSVREMK